MNERVQRLAACFVTPDPAGAPRGRAPGRRRSTGGYRRHVGNHPGPRKPTCGEYPAQIAAGTLNFWPLFCP